MATSLEERLEKLEVLCSEQDYTLQELSALIARQEQEIGRLGRKLGILGEQLASLKTGLGEAIDTSDEKPPHY